MCIDICVYCVVVCASTHLLLSDNIVKISTGGQSTILDLPCGIVTIMIVALYFWPNQEENIIHTQLNMSQVHGQEGVRIEVTSDKLGYKW